MEFKVKTILVTKEGYIHLRKIKLKLEVKHVLLELKIFYMYVQNVEVSIKSLAKNIISGVRNVIIKYISMNMV